MIYKYYYDGFRSVTGLITSVILIFQKLYYNYDTLNIALKKGYVLSTSLTKPHDFNTLEPIKFKRNEYIKKEKTQKSYRIYYLGEQIEDDIIGDKYAMQTNNGKNFIPIFIEKNNKKKNNLTKLARKRIKNEIKNEIIQNQKRENESKSQNNNKLRSFSGYSLGNDNTKSNVKISKYMTIENDIDENIIKEIIHQKQNIHKELKLHNNKIYEKSYDEKEELKQRKNPEILNETFV
jgi:hypothetical protein